MPSESSSLYFTSSIAAITSFPRVSIWDFIFGRAADGRSLTNVAYVDAASGEEISRSEVQRMAKSLAFGLKNRLGLSKGDTILVFSSNSLYFPVIILAIQAAGFICSPANALFKPNELAYQVRDSGAKLVIVGAEQTRVAQDACVDTGARILLMEDKTSDSAIQSVWEFVDEAQVEPEPLGEDEAIDAVALLCYSSGTSGRPKGVKTTHYNITSALLQTLASSPGSFTSNEVWLATLPLSHMYAAFYHIYLAMHIGAKVVIFSKFTLDSFLSAIEEHQATACHIVPPIALRLANSPATTKYSMSSLREWRSAAAPAGQELMQMLEDKCGVTFHTLYAMTETTAVIAMTMQGEKPPPGSCGRLGPNLEAKLEDGELCIKGPNVSPGYHNRSDANTEAFDDEGFMHTGDVVHIDNDGFIYVLDRLKEVIKFNGYQVPPRELEDILFRHSDVRDVAVIGVQDDHRATEVPLACVVLASRISNPQEIALKRKELIDFVSGQVAPFKHLRGGVIFVDQIPKSPAGKVLRRVLRDSIQSAHNTESQVL